MLAAQEAEPLDESEEAAHTAAVVSELSAVMQQTLKVSISSVLHQLPPQLALSIGLEDPVKALYFFVLSLKDYKQCNHMLDVFMATQNAA